MYSLAIDIGATSGKAILSKLVDKQLFVKAIHRFPNNLSERNGKLCWNHDDLFKNIIESLKICKEHKMLPESISIDTWGVDFVLLDKDDKIIGDTVSYRDQRTFEAKEKLHAIISEEDLYKKTGIQIQEFNTIYQLKSTYDNSDDLEKAKCFLMTPDYFSYLLTGKKVNEYTNITTTGLYDMKNNRFDEDLLKMVGAKKEIFPSMLQPSEYIGNLKPEIVKEIGYDLEVYTCLSHDTASAVFSNNIKEELDNVYISSGTWSLVGTVIEKPIVTDSSYEKNLTNEGYTNKRITFIKNIMGLWLIESLRRENGNPSFAEITENVKDLEIDTIIDVNDIRFLSPDSMTDEIDGYLKEHGLKETSSLWEKFYIVYNSLAYFYDKAIKQLEDETGKKFNSIYVMGGGSKAQLLNELTRKHTGKEIKLGHIEATAIGNLLAQVKAKQAYNFEELAEIEVIEEEE